jgi:hypothetical protein
MGIVCWYGRSVKIPANYMILLVISCILLAAAPLWLEWRSIRRRRREDAELRGEWWGRGL